MCVYVRVRVFYSPWTDPLPKRGTDRRRVEGLKRESPRGILCTSTGQKSSTLVTLLWCFLLWGLRGEPGTGLWERLERVFDYSEPLWINYQLQQKVLAVTDRLSVTDSSHCRLFMQRQFHGLQILKWCGIKLTAPFCHIYFYAPLKMFILCMNVTVMLVKRWL